VLVLDHGHHMHYRMTYTYSCKHFTYYKFELCIPWKIAHV